MNLTKTGASFEAASFGMATNTWDERATLKVGDSTLDINVLETSIEASPFGTADITIKGRILRPSICSKKESKSTGVPHGLRLDRVIYAPPATIVYWQDGTKTVVKCCEKDEYSKSIGFMMCAIKKMCGNDTVTFHKMMKQEETK